MKFLIVGDIVGSTGLEKLKEELPKIISEEKIDYTIVNGENSANGKGLRLKEYNYILSLGANVITMGNHVYYRKEMASEYIKLPKLLIPENITNLNANGHVTESKDGKKICTINLIGKACMGDILEKNTSNPFKKIDEILENIKNENVDYIFLDFHAEATAEKIAMGYYLDGRVTCVFGTHTHVQTADEKILENKTAYITDVGMTGPSNSVIGLKKEIALKRFVNEQYAKYECSTNNAIFNAIVVITDDETNIPIEIKRINKDNNIN